jgi:lysophospholipase
MKNGKPTGALCTENYDNLGYVLGTSSNLFNEECLNLPAAANSSTSLTTTLEQILDYAHEVAFADEYYVSSTSTPNVANNVTAQENVSLVDGGESLQNNPIFPFLKPARNISVIINRERQQRRYQQQLLE